MSRADLARACGLTAPTVSSVVTDLLGEHLVLERKPTHPGRGKPANVVELNHESVCILALDLTATDTARSAYLRLNGTIVDRQQVSLSGVRGSDALDLVLDLVQQRLDAAPDHVIAIGVGSAGIVDSSGTVRHALHLDWVDIPLAGQLTERFALPTHVGNDINLTALAARQFRDVPGRQLMLVSITHGVGAGLIVGDTLVEGEFFAAGEIGHITVATDGDPCVCGRRGCLEVYLGADRLRDRLRATDNAGKADVFRAAGRALGFALAGTVSTLNLSGLVLAGPGDLLTEELLESARAEISDRTLALINPNPVIVPLRDDIDLLLHGVLGLVLARELGIR